MLIVNGTGTARAGSLKKAVEKSFGGRPFHALMEAGSILPGLGGPRPGDGPGVGSLRRKFLGLRHRIGYEFNFTSLNLRRAYGYRFRQMTAVALGAASGDSKGALRYLELMNDPAVLDAVDTDSFTSDFIRGVSGNLGPSAFGLTGPRRKAGKLILCGPGANPAEIDFSRFDAAVFNKPVPAISGLDPARIILILNNQWPKERPEELKGWIARNPGARLISPITVEGAVAKNPVFERVPGFLLGASLMGLQRSLFVLSHEFDVESLEVTGYDFSLSRQPYNAWYPSLIAKNYGSLEKGIVLSSMTHDLLLNIRYTRRFIEEHGRVAGGIVGICMRDPADNLGLFEEIYSARTPTTGRENEGGAK